MQDEVLGRMIRTMRVKRRWRQADLAERAGLSRASVWRVEHGRLEEMTVANVRRVCSALDINLEWRAHGRGGDLGRAVSERHSALHESVARDLSKTAQGWEQAHEVSFNVWGERGVIDLLLWHPEHRALLIVELKTELVDIGDLLATMDRRQRLADDIVVGRAWRPAVVSSWVLVARSRTNERRVMEHQTVLRGTFPGDAATVRRWLVKPEGSVRAISLWRTVPGTPTAPSFRVRPRTRPA